MTAPGWKAAATATIITPAEPMWLAGWAARRQPATGAAMELFAKALVLEDAAGSRAVILTADLIAIPRDVASAVAARVQARWGITRDRILFNASHAHTGPEVRPDKVPFFEIPAEYAARIAPYVGRLVESLAALIAAALERLEPVTLQADRAQAAFAVNRRAAGGPVDHDVPILLIHRAGGQLLAVLFGYACHNLTLPPEFCRYHGDYAGVAQAELEKKFPGAVALFLAGAGADQDPAPRGTVELTQAHGAELADGVASRVRAGMSVLSSVPALPRRATGTERLRAAFEEVMLELDPAPSDEILQEDLKSDDLPRRRKAAFLLAARAERRPLASSVGCAVQALRLGDEVLLIALGGEPAVEFALRFKREFAGPLVWVAGYSNDLFGYLPTRRMRQEGGYEGGRATLWSALPAPVAETAEERVVAAVRRVVQQVGAGASEFESGAGSPHSKF